MRWGTRLRPTLGGHRADLSRDEELKFQKEFIAKNGVKRLPTVGGKRAFERLLRIADFKRELREKYRRQDEMNSADNR